MRKSTDPPPLSIGMGAQIYWIQGRIGDLSDDIKLNRRLLIALAMAVGGNTVSYKSEDIGKMIAAFLKGLLPF